MTNLRRSDRIKKKSRKWWLISILSITGLIAGILIHVGFNLYKGYDSETREGKKDIDMKTQPFTILFIGVDQYNAEEEETEGYRTDVLMLAAINPKTKSIKLISIPRDTYTTIPNTNGHKDKINTAAFWAKRKDINPMKNTKEAVEELLDIPVDYYAKINFRGFIDIVNAVDGVDVNVEKDFKIATFGGEIIEFKKGPMHLRGKQALPYVRMRKDDINESGRNKRQQEVIAQVVDKITDPSKIHKLPEIIEILGDNISYDIEISDFATLANTWREIPKENMETVQFDRVNGLIEDEVYLNGVHNNFIYRLTEEERTRISNIFKKHLEIPITEENSEEEESPTSDENSDSDEYRETDENTEVEEEDYET